MNKPQKRPNEPELPDEILGSELKVGDLVGCPPHVITHFEPHPGWYGQPARWAYSGPDWWWLVIDTHHLPRL